LRDTFLPEVYENETHNEKFGHSSDETGKTKQFKITRKVKIEAN
jgi:hypothetical protein